jgi:hypothetical protein
MENSIPENLKYIIGSRKNINNFLLQKEYRKAFGLLILVLERLDDNEKKEFIDYYSVHLQTLGILG